MKGGASIAWLMAAALAVAACLVGGPLRGEAPKPSRLPPLKVNKSTALRLEEGPKVEPRKPGDKPLADNSACYVCHGNYQDEPLVKWHAVENIGCIECHGQSLAHRNDEDHRTPPDVMFAPDGIERECAKCHDDHDAPARKVLAHDADQLHGREETGGDRGVAGRAAEQARVFAPGRFDGIEGGGADNENTHGLRQGCVTLQIAAQSRRSLKRRQASVRSGASRIADTTQMRRAPAALTASRFARLIPPIANHGIVTLAAAQRT